MAKEATLDPVQLELKERRLGQGARTDCCRVEDVSPPELRSLEQIGVLAILRPQFGASRNFGVLSQLEQIPTFRRSSFSALILLPSVPH